MLAVISFSSARKWRALLLQLLSMITLPKRRGKFSGGAEPGSEAGKASASTGLVRAGWRAKSSLA